MNEINNTSDLKSSLDKLSGFVELILNKFDKIKIQNDELVSRNSTLEKSLGDKDSSFYEIVNQKSEYELKIQNLAKQSKELENKLENSKDLEERLYNQVLEFNLLTEKYDDLDHRFTLVSEKANFVTTLSDDLSKEREKNAILSNQVNALEDELSRLREYEITLPKIRAELESQLLIVAEKNKEKANLELEINRLMPVEKNLSIISKELAHKNLLLNDRAQEVEKLKDKIADLDNTVFKLNNKETQLQNTLSNKDSIINELNTLINNSETLINELKEKNSTLENSFNDLIEKDSEIIDLSQKINDYENERINISNEIEVLKQTIARNQNYQDELINEIDRYKEELSSLKITLSAYQQFNPNANIIDASLAVKEIEIRALTAKVGELEEKLKSSNITEVKFDDVNENQTLLEEIEILKDKNQQVVNSYTQLMIDYDELLDEKNEADNMFLDLKKSFELTKSNFNDLNDEFEVARNEYIESVNNLGIVKNQFESEFNKIKDELIIKENIIAKLEEKLDVLNVEKSKFYEIQSNYETEIEGLSQELTSNQSFIDELRNELIQKQESETANLKKIDELKQIINNLSKQIIELENEYEKYKLKEVSLFNDSSSEDSKIINELNTLLELKNVRLNDIEIEMNNLNNQITIANFNSEQYREKVENLEELLKTRYEHINILETQINELIRNKSSISLQNDNIVERIDEFIRLVDKKISEFN